MTPAHHQIKRKSTPSSTSSARTATTVLSSSSSSRNTNGKGTQFPVFDHNDVYSSALDASLKSDGLDDFASVDDATGDTTFIHRQHGTHVVDGSHTPKYNHLDGSGGIASQSIVTLDDEVLFPEERRQLSEEALAKQGNKAATNQGLRGPSNSTIPPHQNDVFHIESEYIDDDFMSETSSHSSASVHDADIFWGSKNNHTSRGATEGRGASSHHQNDRFVEDEKPFSGDIFQYEDGGLLLDNTPVRDGNHDNSSSRNGIADDSDGLSSNPFYSGTGNIKICMYVYVCREVLLTF
jgi:hypothetical protein